MDASNKSRVSDIIKYDMIPGFEAPNNGTQPVLVPKIVLGVILNNHCIQYDTLNRVFAFSLQYLLE